MDLQVQLLRAVQVLNHDALSCNRVAANQWLVQFQQTDAAWEVATGILTAEFRPVKDYEVELFAAQILKLKIQSDLASLPPDGRSALQNALLLSATRYSTGPPQLLTQICLALSALILRSPESLTLIESLFNSLFNFQHQASDSNAMLELLTVLPEELELRSTNADRRWACTQELLCRTPCVLKFLLHLSETEAVDNSHKRCRVLRCLLSWVRMGCFFELDQAAVPNHPLVSFSFSSLQVADSFNIALEVLGELINRHEVVPVAFLVQMVSVKDALLVPALVTRNENVIKGLIWMMAELGQAAPSLVAQGTPEALALTDALLRCVSFQSSSWIIAESSLPFWSSLGEYILQSNERDKRQMATAIYTALLEALIGRVQVGSCAYSEDDVDKSSGLPDGLAQFRVNLEETLLTVCRVLGPTQYVAQVLNRINVFHEYSFPWQVLEARLFLLYAASDIILEGPRLDLSSLVNVLLAMHEARPTESGMDLLQRSAAQVVGSFARWICVHPAAVLALLSFLASGLSVPLAASASATSIRRICEEVSSMSSEPANLECLLWIGEGLHKLKLSFKEEEEILCAIGRALAMVTSPGFINDALRRVLRPAYESLEELLAAGPELRAMEHTSLSDSGVRSLHRLGVLLNQLPTLKLPAVDEVFIGILAQFWPLLEQLMGSRYMEISGLATATCRALCEAFQAGGQYFVPLLPRIVKATSQNFLSFQSHICFMKLATCIMDEYGQEKDYGTLFLEALGVFSTSGAVISLNSSYACDQEPELADAYMSLMSTFLRNCPKEVVAAAEVHVELCLSKATICCTVMHRGAALSAMSFISCFLECTLASLGEYTMPDCLLKASATRICSQSGESIVSGMLYALLGPSAMSRIYKATAILQQLAAVCDACDRLNTKYPVGWTALQCWIVSAIQALPSEYLKQGEADELSATWFEALRAAAADEANVGGRSLKRVLREFADQHRSSNPAICVS